MPLSPRSLVILLLSPQEPPALGGLLRPLGAGRGVRRGGPQGRLQASRPPVAPWCTENRCAEGEPRASVGIGGDLCDRFDTRPNRFTPAALSPAHTTPWEIAPEQEMVMLLHASTNRRTQKVKPFFPGRIPHICMSQTSAPRRPRTCATVCSRPSPTRTPSSATRRAPNPLPHLPCLQSGCGATGWVVLVCRFVSLGIAHEGSGRLMV